MKKSLIIIVLLTIILLAGCQKNADIIGKWTLKESKDLGYGVKITAAEFTFNADRTYRWKYQRERDGDYWYYPETRTFSPATASEGTMITDDIVGMSVPCCYRISGSKMDIYTIDYLGNEVIQLTLKKAR